MSTIRVTSFALFTPPASPSPLEGVQVLTGAGAARVSSEGRIELPMASVPVHAEQLATRLPKNALLMLYGRQDALTELQVMRREARRVHAEFVWADLDVDVGDLRALTVDRAALRHEGPKLRFVNWRRMHSALQAELLATFSQLAAEAGAPLNADLKRDAQVGSRPDLWDNVFAKDADFQHVDVIAIPLADDPASPGTVRYLAYVRPTAKVTFIAQGSDRVTFVWPYGPG
ncbi:hypothetical protein [Scleromatobacter humisilvae]|uniref:Uncharacterized protein n=1 Tax=Scleromatobacter humisilvae TaxID=2897159 RepID=A0A9X2C3E6_9BURK|nr:hypothetical protein [Scleromatobacter humisilvae]MCK9687350.1 hypothetical protein [Scleromatobacter humisilvae]